MLAADAQFDFRTGLAAFFCSHLHQLAYAILVETCERIAFEDLVLIIGAQELRSIITAEAKGHLSKVVCAE